ncbi:MAG TPA: hypothetical protein VME46_16250 [Acidimicrobiales bacterium]|nr:hypothetical protein [Acidimicrobiales bacterium]
MEPIVGDGEGRLSCPARTLRVVHYAIGAGELVCLGYVWFCALARRRDAWLRASIAVLVGEGVALVAAKGCPLGVFQRRAGDDVPMFELWFGPRVATFALPGFAALALVGAALLGLRPAEPSSPDSRALHMSDYAAAFVQPTHDERPTRALLRMARDGARVLVFSQRWQR